MIGRPAAGVRLAVLVGAVLAGAAIPARAQPARRPRPLENIRVLKGWDGERVRAEMQRMADALGVQCSHCHVQGNFASDEKREKRTARRMIEMTMGLNAEYFDGASTRPDTSPLGRVTCYTCHQGEPTPKLSPGPGAQR
ncbi:MAG: c-type cytochrome [Vicinamibacterales bacterium]